MPDFRQTGEKPLRPQDKLGLDVKITQRELSPDEWASNTLSDIGKRLTPTDHMHMGSIAIHWYRTPDRVVLKVGAEHGETLHDVANISMLCLGDMNESITSMGIANLVVRLKQHFGRTHKTTDSKDKRGTGN